MAYETGSYATLEQLVTALKIFSEANGWTTDEFSDFRGGKRLSHHNADGVYLHWYSSNNVQINAYYRDTNGSYHGSSVTRLVLHPGTGYDSSKHPAWQPGVAGGTAIYTTNASASSRQIFNTGQIPVYGVYHFVAAPGLLAILLDTGGTFFRHIVVDRVAKLSGGDLDYVASAQYGSCNAPSDADPVAAFLQNDYFSSAYFRYNDRTGKLAGGQWSGQIINQDTAHVPQAADPYVSGSSGNSFYNLLAYTQPSGVNGVVPLYPALYFKRVSNVLRPAGHLEHVARINMSNFVNGQQVQTTSGAWRVFNTGYPERVIAIRSDL